MSTKSVGVLLCATLMIGSPLLVNAVSYPVTEHRQLTEKTAVTAGAKVYLFESGTSDVRRAIAAGDTLSVRGERHGKVKQVGKIRVLGYHGENYLQGEVVEGEIRHDDVAQKGGASCLVILEEEMLQ